MDAADSMSMKNDIAKIEMEQRDGSFPNRLMRRQQTFESLSPTIVQIHLTRDLIYVLHLTPVVFFLGAD